MCMWANLEKTSSYLVLSFIRGNCNFSIKYILPELACSSTTSLHGHFQLYVTRHLRELMTFVEHRRLFSPGAPHREWAACSLARPCALHRGRARALHRGGWIRPSSHRTFLLRQRRKATPSFPNQTLTLAMKFQ